MLELIGAILLIGLVYWLISLIPIPDPFKQIVLVILIIFAVLVCLQFLFGIDLYNHMHSRVWR